MQNRKLRSHGGIREPAPTLTDVETWIIFLDELKLEHMVIPQKDKISIEYVKTDFTGDVYYIIEFKLSGEFVDLKTLGGE